MFLFVSQACFQQTGFKKTALSTALLMLLPLTAQAEPSYEAAEQAVNDAQPDAVESVQPQQNRLPDGRAKNHRFPHWPHHMQANKTLIPPPPPGPYKSSALSDYSVQAPVRRSVKQPPRRPPMRNNSAAAPMEMFSPDIPWPTNLRPERKMPERQLSGSGQHYAGERGAPNMPYGPAAAQRYGAYNNYGRQPQANLSTPYRNDMGMGNSRWMPNMSMAPPGPYNSRWNSNRWNYSPNFSPNYGSNNLPNFEPRYRQPMTGSNGMSPANRSYR